MQGLGSRSSCAARPGESEREAARACVRVAASSSLCTVLNHTLAHSHVRALSLSLSLSLCSEAEVSSGYSPFVSFDVHDMDTLVPSLLGLGAVLDGPVQYDTLGKVAALRSPDGLMIALREPTTTTTTTTI